MSDSPRQVSPTFFMNASTATTDTPLRQYPSLVVRLSITVKAVNLPNGEAS
jgi:hypothetical protein